MMAEKYERFDKKDLAVALPVGDDRLRGLDLVRVPQFSKTRTYTPLYESHYGNPTHEHIYSGRKKSLNLQSAHIAINHMYFGRVSDTDTFATDMTLKAQRFEEDDDFNFEGLDSKLLEAVALYNKGRERKLSDRARRFGKAVAERSVFVVATDPAEFTGENNPDFFIAQTVDMTMLRDGNKMVIEPVVESLIGEKGLMPENFYAIRGLYVPTHL